MKNQTIRIQLPAPVLREIIEEDAELMVEIKKAALGNAVNEIANKVVSKLNVDIEDAIKKELTNKDGWSFRTKPKIRTQITKTVKDLATSTIDELAKEWVKDRFEKLNIGKYLEKEARSMMTYYIKEEIEKARHDIQMIAREELGKALKDKLNL